MSPTFALLRLPLQRLPLAASLLGLLLLAVLASLATAAWRASDTLLSLAVMLLMAANLVWHLLAGWMLRELPRDEQWLLPGLRRRLIRLGLWQGLAWMVPGALLGGWQSGWSDGLLLGALGLLLAALGLCLGAGRAVALWLSLAALVLNALAPAWLHHPALWLSPAGTALVFALALLLLWLALRPLGRLKDRAPAPSPLQALPAGQAADGGARPRLWRRLLGLFEALAERAMYRQLERYRRQSSPRRRIALVRSLLLPHDNAAAIALRLLGLGVLVGGYFLLRRHNPQQDASFVVCYSLLVALTRFTQIGRGLQRLQPHLADLYLTLAPVEHADYQRSVAGALRVLVPQAVIQALGFALLGLLVLHQGNPLPLLWLCLIVASCYALVALTLQLIGPQGPVGRGLLNALVVGAAAMTFSLGRWLVELFGVLPGGLLLAVPALSFALGVGYAAQQEYLRRRPCFDAPAD